MKPQGFLILVWLCSGAGAVGGSILGNAFGSRGPFIGALIGGLVMAALSARLGARIGFIAAANLHWRWAMGAGLLVLQAGCFASHPRQLVDVAPPARVRVQSATGVSVHPEGSPADGSCTTRSISGRVTRRDGDTLVLRQVRFETPPAGGSACRWVGNYVVVPADSAPLTVREVRFSVGRTLYAVVLMIPVFIAIAVIAGQEVVP